MAEEHTPNQKTSRTAEDKLESSKTHVRRAAEDLKSAAGAVASEYRGKAEEAWGDARGRAEAAWGDATDRARTFQQDAEQCRSRKSNQSRRDSSWYRICPRDDFSSIAAVGQKIWLPKPYEPAIRRDIPDCLTASFRW